MGRKLFYIPALVLAGILSVSCLNTGEDEPQEVVATVGTYILNEGIGNSEDVLLGYYDTIKDLPYGTQDIFKMNNGGQSLGINPHDMLIQDDYLVVSVTGSKEIKVIDRTSCKLLSVITAEAEGQKLSPKCLVAFDETIYATFAEGYVGKVSIAGSKIATLTKVGDNPEGIAVCKSQVYVANSGSAPDYGTTVTVLTDDDLVVKKEISVAANPQKLVATGDNRVFVISYGDGKDVPASLQMIDVTGDVKVVKGIDHPYDFALRHGDYSLYVVDRYTDGTGTTTSSVIKFNTAHDAEYVGMLPESDVLGSVAAVSVDNMTGAIYVCTSDGKNIGEMAIYSDREVLAKKVTTGGVNTRKVAFVKGTIWI